MSTGSGHGPWARRRQPDVGPAVTMVTTVVMVTGLTRLNMVIGSAAVLS